MSYPGFDIHYADDVMWEVYYNGGTKIVYAPSEAVAIQRFLAKYPNATIRKVIKK